MPLFKKRGFTLVEMMIVVVILGLLTGIVSTRFGSVLRRAREGNLKSNLALVRSSLNIYFADNLAFFPQGSTGTNQSTLSDTLVPKYLKEIPKCYVYPYFNETNTVDNVGSSNLFAADPTADGEWAYVSVQSNSDWGMFLIEAYDADSKGTIWSSY